LGREPAGVGGSETYGRLLESPDQFIEQDGSSVTSAEHSILVNEALALIRESFEPKTWQAFWRTAADGVPTNVVAKELGMQPAAVRKAKSRVLRRLRDELGQLLGDLEADEV